MFCLRFCSDGKVKRRISCKLFGGLLCIFLAASIVFFEQMTTPEPSWAGMPEVVPGNLIRFHVIANSDSEEDQLLKYAVRDEILKKTAPRLAESASLEESRKILQEMEEEIVLIAESVISEWNKEYPVTFNYGTFSFPTKSYGNIVLPGGEYEAVKIIIGEGKGANWWCVLFPPLCFVNVEESTSLPVDGKPGVPIDEKEEKEGLTFKGKKVGFYFAEFFK